MEIVKNTISRREVFGATAALPFVTDCQASDRSSELSCRAWLAKTAEIERLLLVWGDVEARLAAQFGWFKLTDAERQALPEGRALREIDDRVDGLVNERGALLHSLPGLAATTRSAIVLKILVTSHFLPAEDFPEAHALIVSVLRDLTTATSHA